MLKSISAKLQLWFFAACSMMHPHRKHYTSDTKDPNCAISPQCVIYRGKFFPRLATIFQKNLQMINQSFLACKYPLASLGNIDQSKRYHLETVRKIITMKEREKKRELQVVTIVCILHEVTSFAPLSCPRLVTCALCNWPASPRRKVHE